MPSDRYVVRSAEIAALPGEDKAHFLNVNARAISKSLGDLTGITGFGFHLVEIAPGQDSTEPHFHYREDECVFILFGTATATLGDETIAVGPGDFLGYRKAGLPHGLRNSGTEPLCCIVVGERGDTDIVDYPGQKKRMFRTAGLPWNVVDLTDIQDRPK